MDWLREVIQHRMEEKFKKAQKELKKIREKQKADEIKAFRGDDELDGQIEQ